MLSAERPLYFTNSSTIHCCVRPFGSTCGDITPNFARLKGIRIERGWTRQLKDIIGGPNGCTHQWELLGRVAAVAYQTTNNARQAKFPRKTGEIPRTFNTCHMYTPESSETQRRWPELYTGPKKSAAHS